jgi:ferric-dicitrate binding protein FerR (iron transport regulator)
MRELRAQSRVCDRAREYSSRSLDGELSDFERALLETHLERCAACRAYSVELTEIVTRLRVAPLEALPQPISLPSRRRVRARVFQGAAAVAAAAVAATAGLVGSLQSHPTEARPNPTLDAIVRADDFHSQDVQLMHQFRAMANMPKKSIVLAQSGKKPT